MPTVVYTAGPRKPYEPKDLVDELNEQADAEERRAEQMEGCFWLGDMPPSVAHREQASMLRRAAIEIEMARRARKKAQP